MSTQRYDYKRLRVSNYGGIDVVGFDTYPEDSVLAGQTRKSFIDNYPDEAAAKAAHPDATDYTSHWVEAPICLNHLSDGPDVDFYFESDFDFDY